MAVTKRSQRCMAVSEQCLRLRIVTRLGDRCTAVPLQVQGSDETKVEVHGSVRAQLTVKNSYKIRREVHCSATAGARQAVIKREVHSSATVGARQ